MDAEVKTEQHQNKRRIQNTKRVDRLEVFDQPKAGRQIKDHIHIVWNTTFLPA